MATALCGYALTCFLNMVAARILSAEEFGAFSATISMVAIVCTVATLGLEKCALRLLPEYVQRKLQSRTKGYLIFGIAISVGVGALCASGAFVFYDAARPHSANLEPLKQMLWFVPTITLFLFALEVATAFGSTIGSTVIYRLIVPAAAVVAVSGLSLFVEHVTLRETIFAFGATWVVGLLMMVILIWRRIPQGVAAARAEYAPRDWLTQSVGYLGFSLIMTLFNQGAIVVLEVLKGDRVGVGLMAAAMQVAGFIVLAQTATARVYSPQLARLITAGDAAGERALMRSRMKFMVLISGVFLALVVFCGREMLGVFGASYRDAYPTLIVLTIGNCANTILGFAPTVLQFHGATKRTVVIAGTGMIIALIGMTLVARSGTYGEVAYAYSAALIATFVALHIASAKR